MSSSGTAEIPGSEEWERFCLSDGKRFDTSFLETSDKDASIVSNKVGAKEASQWVEDVKNNKIETFVPVEIRNSFPDSQLQNTSQNIKVNMTTLWVRVNSNKVEYESHNHLIQERKGTVAEAENKQDKA